MTKQKDIRSNSIIKKTIAILCVMFTIVSIFGCLNIKPMNTSAATYESLSYGFNGGSTGYHNRSVAGTYVSQSWIKVKCTGWGEYSVTIDKCYECTSAKQHRYGYVYFKNSSGKVLHIMYIYQTKPYIRILNTRIAVPNVENGTEYIPVESNTPFRYSLDDRNNYLKPCSGTMGNNLGNQYSSYRTYYVPVTTKTVNKSGIQRQFTFYVNGVSFTCNRQSQVIQNTAPKETTKYMFSGKASGYNLTFTGMRPFKSSIDETYDYIVLLWDMPSTFFYGQDNRSIKKEELKEAALNNNIKIEMPKNSDIGKLKVFIDDEWRAYASVTLHKENLGMTIEPYGFAGELGQFECSWQEIK